MTRQLGRIAPDVGKAATGGDVPFTTARAVGLGEGTRLTSERERCRVEIADRPDDPLDAPAGAWGY